MNKPELREAILASRANRTESQLQNLGQKFAAGPWRDLITEGPVTFFLSMDTEPPTTQLRAALGESNIDVYLPIMRPARQLAWGLDTGDFIRNNYGIDEPAETAIDLNTTTAMFIPGLAMGRDGSRMGRGAGYYDRALENIASHTAGGPLRIGFVFDEEVFDTVPHEEHDQFIDCILTPTQLIWCQR